MLIELIFREAHALVDWERAETGYVPVMEVQRIFTELRLKIGVEG